MLVMIVVVMIVVVMMKMMKMMMMMMMMMSNIACKSRITMSNATQVLRGQISLQHVQHSLTDAAESLLGARAKKPTGHQEVAGASLSRMLF